MTAPVALAGVDHWYGEGALRRQVLHGVSLAVAPGEIVLLTGPSGSGKTTLLTLVGALRAPQAGSVQVLGRELRGASRDDRARTRRAIGFIFQQHNLLGFLTARENVQLAAQLQPGPARERAAAMLGQVGLGDLLDRHPARLSGGQRQRVAIARALVGEPRLLLADEPTAALDAASGREVVELLRRLARERAAPVLMVTHDPRVLDVADRVVRMEDGRLV